MPAMAKPISLSHPSRDTPLRVAEAAGAGFPSPAQDWEETGIDLAALLALDRPASFVFRVSGDSMVDAGLFNDDTLIVDRDLNTKDGSLVVAVCDGGFIVRELGTLDGIPHLIGRNAADPYPPRKCDEDVEIWGVVRASVRHWAK